MKHPPYHLRVNKAIDRFLLIEILDRLKRNGVDLSNYTYYGFGGPFLEDCRLIHDRCPEISIVSIEKDRETFKRQKFHCFSKQLELLDGSFKSFLAQFSSRDGEIFWLDYTNLSLGHFNDFKDVLGKVSENSIIKITVRAEPAPKELTSENRERKWRDFRNRYREEKWEVFQKKYREEKWRDFKEKYHEILPSKAQPTDIEERWSFINLLQKMLQMASQQALPALGESIFQLLDSCYYNDQTQMLSVTGIVCNKKEVSEVQKWFKDLPFINLTWAEPRRIDVPILSIKERLHLEQHTPTLDRTGHTVSDALGYKIDNGEKHIEKLKQYEEYYKYYPYFVRVLI
ncbi:MAG: hypothetical protein OXM61_18550 [Candidatus Poribacteria bacterium]|nr:hypothetical protein [Candidatus Poribacteria bacterium]